MLARTLLLRIQRALYQRLRTAVRDYVGGMNAELQKYFQDYSREFSRFTKITNHSELLTQMASSEIIMCGDYHTLAQAQRTVLRLLRDLYPLCRREKLELIVALEMFRPFDESSLRKFLADELTESEFLKKVGYQKNWNFPWENYKPLLDFAKERKLRVVGINSKSDGRKRQSLDKRDEFAGKAIARLAKENPRAKILVLMGDLHLSSAHLPAAVKRHLAKDKLERNMLTVLQNVEPFYWKLAEKGMEQVVDIVRVKEKVYCLLNTPPWVKLQSHLRWMELVTEVEPTLKKFGEEGSGGLLSIESALQELDQEDEVRELLTVITDFLGLEPPKGDDFTVYGPTELDFINRLKRNGNWSRAEVVSLSRYLGEFKSHFIPRENIFYFATLNLNHAATQAAIYLHSRLTGFSRVFQNPRDDFYLFIWLEALGFLGSKIINHKRKCKSLEDLQNISYATLEGANRDDASIAKFVLEHVAKERAGGVKRLPGLGKRPGSDETVYYYKASKVLGQLAGDGLYRSLVDGKLSRDKVRELFASSFQDLSPDEVRAEYLACTKRLDVDGYRG